MLFEPVPRISIELRIEPGASQLLWGEKISIKAPSWEINYYSSTLKDCHSLPP